MPPTCQSCITAVATHGKKEGPKQYCKNCAKGIEGVGDLTRKHCKEETCFKEPTYNYPTEKTTAYCKTHMKPGMEDIKHKKCEYVDDEGLVRIADIFNIARIYDNIDLSWMLKKYNKD